MYNKAGSGFTLIYGTDKDETFTGKITFPRFSEQGIWTITALVLRDSMETSPKGNQAWLNESDLKKMGFPTKLQITSQPRG